MTLIALFTLVNAVKLPNMPFCSSHYSLAYRAGCGNSNITGIVPGLDWPCYRIFWGPLYPLFSPGICQYFISGTVASSHSQLIIIFSSSLTCLRLACKFFLFDCQFCAWSCCNRGYSSVYYVAYIDGARRARFVEYVPVYSLKQWKTQFSAWSVPNLL